jgi:hypothetical protein
MASPPTPQEVAKAVGWLSRNVPTIIAWFKFFGGVVKQVKDGVQKNSERIPPA